MKNKTKNTGRLRRFFLGLMGPTLSKAVISRALGKRIDRTPAAFPADLGRCSDILFILPADRVEMIFQLENLFSVLGRYKESTFTFVCPAASSPFVSGLKNARVIKYDPAKFLLYSAEFNRVMKELTTRVFDICVMLERQYTLAHLYLVGVSRAHLRVGWEDRRGGLADRRYDPTDRRAERRDNPADRRDGPANRRDGPANRRDDPPPVNRSYSNGFPFLNIRLLGIPRENVTLWERNMEVAKILNAEADPKVRWGVQKSTAEDIAQLLGEYKLKREPALVCVDLASIERGCGREWGAELIKALRASGAGQFYIFGGLEGEPEQDSFKDAPFPVLPPMSIPRIAALMACTDLVITGTGALLGLAQISAGKIVPVLTKEQAETYCKRSGRIMPVMFELKPGAGAVGEVVKNVRALISKY